MPYGCEVRAIDGTTVTLEVVPEQPDCEPFYRAPAFALGLLLDDLGTALAAAVGGDDALDRLAAGQVDAARWIAGVDVAIVRRGSFAEHRAPVARYRITVTDRRHLAHLRPGARHDSYAWLEQADSALPDDVVFEPRQRVAVGSYAIGDRVAIHADLALTPGGTCGRGVVEARATSRSAPTGWRGGTVVHRVALDHGVRVWAFAETLRRAPADTYEAAWREPARFFADLQARAPLERARALQFMALRGGGDGRLVAFAGTIAGRAPWMFGLLRRLEVLHAVDVATALLAGWVDDPFGCTKRLDRRIVGVELAAGDVIEGYHFEYCCPVELVVGGLTMVLAERPTPLPASAALARALAALPGLGFGYAPRVWEERTAYLRAACAGAAPPLPELFGPGPDSRGHQRARALGLDGAALIEPGDVDLYRP